MSLCPHDRRVLASSDAAGYLYYSCEACRGLWIPGASLHRALSARGTGELRVAAVARTGGVLCPDCAAACGTLVAEGCTVDTCPRCRGVWLDFGEVSKLRLWFPDDSAVVAADAGRRPTEAQKTEAGASVVIVVADLMMAILS
ncbi:MAG: zf-TFIIB domain-containing protein [Limisphaerales bacterium]